MKIYFLSSQPCALTLNGVYFGLTDRFCKFAEISLKDNILATFTPEGALPLSLFVNENLRFSPPKGFEIYLLKDSLAVYAKTFPPADLSLRVFDQKRLDNCLVTLFQQGTVQLSVEWDNQLFNATLPPSFAGSTLSFHGGLFFLEGENRLAAFTREGKCVLEEEILSFSFEENRLNATLPLFDSLQCVANCAWELSETDCRLQKFNVKTKRFEGTERLLPYVFFESVLIGGNFEAYLSDELLPEKDKLKGFIGEFVSVALTEDPYTCALLRKKGENLYEAAYFTVEVKEGKICDIKG